jgi:hypothetical protein
MPTAVAMAIEVAEEEAEATMAVALAEVHSILAEHGDETDGIGEKNGVVVFQTKEAREDESRVFNWSYGGRNTETNTHAHPLQWVFFMIVARHGTRTWPMRDEHESNDVDR